MIVVTGGAGFIGSGLIWQLNKLGRSDIVVVDDLGDEDKWLNLRKLNFETVLPVADFLDSLGEGFYEIDAVFHMGACSSTTETDADFLMSNNVHYSMSLFNFCTEFQIPFIYASSAATYGEGLLGYEDDPETMPQLLPINKYGWSKQLFDKWVLKQEKHPPLWAGFKFFNVYGPQEYHKGGQASVVYHAYPQVRDQKSLKLFKSYRDGIGHGEQKRDFVYLKDILDVMMDFFQKPEPKRSGIYNLGTGEARSFADLGRAVFLAMGEKDAKFEWIEMPDSLKKQYQYFTQAHLERLRTVGGYEGSFMSLEDGVKDYVQNYLLKEDPFL